MRALLMFNNMNLLCFQAAKVTNFHKKFSVR